MTKFMKKLTGLALGLALITGVGVGVSAMQKESIEVNAKTVTINVVKDSTSVSNDDITLSIDDSVGAGYSPWRLYAEKKITVSSETLTFASFTVSTTSGSFSGSCSVGSFNGNTWSNKSAVSSMTYTHKKGAAQVRISSITVTTTGGTEYTVTNTLTNCSSSNTSTTITEGSEYTATITPNSGYALDNENATVTMGGNDITTSVYTSGSISIPNVSGNITITVSGKTPSNFSITNTLTNCSSSNSSTTITEGSEYTATITPNSGYALDNENATVTMGGNDITSTAYSSGSISISSVSGNIVITVGAKTATGVLETGWYYMTSIVTDFYAKESDTTPVETNVDNSDKCAVPSKATSGTTLPTWTQFDKEINPEYAFNFELIDQDTYIISYFVSNVKYYLYYLSGTDGLRTTENKNEANNFNIAKDGDDYLIYTNVSGTDRYLSYMYTSTKQQIRGYAATKDYKSLYDSSSSTHRIQRLNLIPQLTNWSDAFYSSLKQGANPICKGYGQTDTTNLKTAWDEKATTFAALQPETKEIAKTASASESGTIVEQAMHLYDWCVSHYDTTICSQFITGRTVNALYSINKISSNSDTTIAIVAVVSLIGVSAIGGYFFIRKTKHE